MHRGLGEQQQDGRADVPALGPPASPAAASRTGSATAKVRAVPVLVRVVGGMDMPSLVKIVTCLHEMSFL